MYRNIKLEAFDKSVKNKFNLYNSLFLNLPHHKIENIGILLPILYLDCKIGLEAGQDPQTILEEFFAKQTDIKTEQDKIDFIFRIIQYIERQIVLFDSIEDAAFSEIKKYDNDLSVKDFIGIINSRGNLMLILDKLSDFSARLVFTAHPTQFYPPSVLDIISRLRLLIQENKIDEIDITLQQLAMSSFINSEKPTPVDEAGNIIYYLRNVYYNAVAQLYSEIKNSVPENNFSNTNIIKLGFWPGGDRDGNPYVTAETTQKVADNLRMALMKCYYNDLKLLEQKLSFKGVQDKISDLRRKISKGMFNPDFTIDYTTILNPLNRVKELVNSHYNSLYIEDIESMTDKVEIFKTHFASLDIRQNHEIHKDAVELILKKNHISPKNTDDYISILLNKELELNPDDFDENPIVKDTILTIQSLKKIQDKNGEEACNRYIISNSENEFSVLFVYALFRWCGYTNSMLHFDIIPLFETMEGMRTAEKTMHTLFRIQQYRVYLQNRQNKQTIMLGFSDGTKDGGYLKANWEIFKTKEKLTAVCNTYDLKAIFFDGRGGPPARGGGKTQRFYAAQGPNIANHEIQMTVQGQTITSKYGTAEQFTNNCEQLLTAGLSTALFEKENTISNESCNLIERLSELSFEKYTALKNHPLFIPYLENKSTLKYYGEANIGSRPAKRGNKKKLELNDLRAISYVGSWSQLKQNVPGYFGMGTALKTLADEGKSSDLRKLFTEVPYFKALILNSMMSLTKSNFNLTAYIASDPEYGEFWKILHSEYELSKTMILQISGYTVLMEEEPATRNSIEIREKIVLPLLIIQQYALQKIEQNTEMKQIYQKIVQRSLYGNINAGRNSA